MSFLLHFIWQWGKLCFALFKFEEKLQRLCSCDRKCCNQTECMNYLQFYKLVKIRQKLVGSQEFKKKKHLGLKVNLGGISWHGLGNRLSTLTHSVVSIFAVGNRVLHSANTSEMPAYGCVDAMPLMLTHQKNIHEKSTYSGDAHGWGHAKTIHFMHKLREGPAQTYCMTH